MIVYPLHARSESLSLWRERDGDAFRLEAAQESRLLDRLHVGLVGGHDLLFDELQQGVIQRVHAKLFAGLDDRRDLEGLAFANQVRNRGGRKQDFARSDATAADLLA